MLENHFCTVDFELMRVQDQFVSPCFHVEVNFDSPLVAIGTTELNAVYRKRIMSRFHSCNGSHISCLLKRAEVYAYVSGRVSRSLAAMLMVMLLPSVVVE